MDESSFFFSFFLSHTREEKKSKYNFFFFAFPVERLNISTVCFSSLLLLYVLIECFVSHFFLFLVRGRGWPCYRIRSYRAVAQSSCGASCVP